MVTSPPALILQVPVTWVRAAGWETSSSGAGDSAWADPPAGTAGPCFTPAAPTAAWAMVGAAAVAWALLAQEEL